MSKIDYGKDFEYASTRLSGTIIRHDGWPVYVHKVFYDTGCAKIYNILKDDYEVVPLSECDLSPVPLGFVNTDLQHFYARRSPCRFYKQGLTQNVLVVKNYMSFNSPVIAKTIKGLYPSILECAEYIANEECVSKAFSRKFGLLKHKKKGAFKLEYIDRKVGEVAINQGANSFNLHLDEQYEYLKETLEEAINA